MEKNLRNDDYKWSDYLASLKKDAEVDPKGVTETLFKLLEGYMSIEDEIGANLNDIVWALTEGFYYKDGADNVRFAYHLDTGCDAIGLLAMKDGEVIACLPYRDYGKEWALHEDELKEGNQQDEN